MKVHSVTNMSLIYRPVILLVLTVTAIAGFFWNAERSATKTAAFQPSALGKLAFQRTSFFTSGSAATSLLAVNGDGTGETTLATAGIPPLFNGEASWAPNGSKLAYVQDFDVYVMNADGSGKVNITNTGTSFLERNPSWSSTETIAYERDSTIWTMTPSGSNQAQFISITQPSPTKPAWSPDATKLAFVSGGEIWVINADGTNERRVTNTGGASDPAWSPDGARLVFGKPGSGILVINLNGTGETNLTTSVQDSKPAWSNDGTKIAFVRRGTATNGIFTMDVAGANQLRIVADNPTQPGRNENDDPAWQPVAVTPNTVIVSGRVTRNGESLSGVSINLTGSTTLATTTNSLGEFRFDSLPQTGSYTVTPALANHIFTPVRRIFENPTANQIANFAAGQTCSTPGCKVNGKITFVRGSDVFVSSADGLNPVNLTGGAGINEDPAFSPDGNRIVFRTDRDGNYEIYRVNVDGSNALRLTNSAGTDEYPAYSPDGSKIVFVSSRDGNEEIYTINAADGSNPLRLTNNTIPDREPTFSADGTKIAFSRPYNGTPSGLRAIYTMSATDGSNAVQISTPPSPLSDFSPAFSPDGTKLLFWRYNAGPFTSEFFLADADGRNPVSTGITGFVYKPSFSPDGTKLIYSRYSTGANRYDVQTYPVAGGSAQTVLQDGHHVDWQPIAPAVRRPPFDFDGDGRADVAVFRPSEGMWYILRSSDLGLTQRAFALAGDIPVPSDFDGDSKTDIAIYRPSNGDFWSLSSINGQQVNAHLGQTGDIAMPSDIDGDGRSDYVVYRPSTGRWYRASTATGILSEIWFGATGDKPVIGDFNGDGKADPAIFRPSDGNWWWLSSADGVQRATRWGIAEDTPVPADFDGDGKTDFAVFRPSTGVWYVINSSTGAFTIVPFGLSGDKPVPADYDGDGKADIAVYRPSDGIWYLLRSTAGFTGFRWGVASDIPLPNALIY